MADKGATQWSAKKPGQGWVAVRQNTAGTLILWRYAGTGTTTAGDGGGGSSSGGSSGGSGGGGTGGGGSGNDGKAYIEEYQQRFFKDGKPPAELLEKAKKNNWSIAFFIHKVRLEDPRYLKSEEARTILPDFNRTMKILFPGLSDKLKQNALMKSSLYKRMAVWYLRNGIAGLKNGDEMLYAKITGTKQWNRQNPYWKMYAKNADISVQAEANPVAYKAHLQALQQAFKDTGMEMPEDYYKAFFRSRYASKSGFEGFTQNLGQLAQQGTAFNWFEGRQATTNEKKQVLFGGNQQAPLKSRLQQHFGIRESFVKNEEKGFGAEMNQQNKLIKSTI